MVIKEGTIAVIPSTGRQGCSVLHQLLSSTEQRKYNWRLRGISRQMNNAKCQDLMKRNVELCQVDLNQGKSENLKKCLSGAYAVFAYTDYYKKENNETEQGKLIAELARECGVKHFIWSTLPDMQKATNGKYEVLHFTGKSRVDDTVRRLQFEYHTLVQPAFFFQNILEYENLKPVKGSNGELVLSWPCRPNVHIAGIDIRDMGAVVEGILLNPEKYNGKTVRVSSGLFTPAEVADLITEIAGKKCHFRTISDKEATDKGWMPELIEMFRTFEMVGYYGGAEIGNEARELNPRMKSLKDFLQESDHQKRLKDLC